jgi:hypothetical protein
MRVSPVIGVERDAYLKGRKDRRGGLREAQPIAVIAWRLHVRAPHAKRRPPHS